MKRPAALPCAFILSSFSAIHVYWALGGTAFATAAVPARTDERAGTESALFHPGPVSTMAVALCLAAGAGGVLTAGFSGKAKGPARLVALAFALRAAGDFRYVGLSKRVQNTDFARRDSRVYTPLCIAVATMAGRASA